MIERESTPPATVVVSHDTRLESDKARWTDWIHLSNLAQHLGDDAVITTTRTFVPGVPAAAPPPETRPTAPVTGEVDLDDVFDTQARDLAAAAVAAGWNELEVGMSAGDADDTPIEVAWPRRRIGVLAAGVPRPSTLGDWDIRVADEWTTQSLIDALEHGGT